jgi:D-3-phosphoglycerate dehydrogenase
MKVLITNPIDQEAVNLLEKYSQVEILDISRGEELLECIDDVDVLFNRIDEVKVNREVIDRGKKIRLIARHGSGYGNVDLAYATSKRIPVTYTAGSNAHSVAEYMMGLLLVLTKRIFEAAGATRTGSFQRTQFKGIELYGKVFGIIGVGHIGRDVVRLAHAFGMKVLAYHPRPSAAKLVDLPLELVDLPTLLKKSDFISIHAALNPATTGLIGVEELGMMKKTAFLLNISRGELVDEAALVQALQNNQIAGAALDVVQDEPVKKTNPLLYLKNAMVLPHIASMTYEAQKRTALWAAEDIIRFIRGQRPERVVNPEVFDRANK